LGVTARYAKAHGWIINAITGWLSAYYMEDPGFRVRRHAQEPDTGMEVWVCELGEGMSMKRLIRRLQVDLPPGRVHEHSAPDDGRIRYIIDLP